MTFLLLLTALLLPPQATQPFTEDQLLNVSRAIKTLGEDQIVAMVQTRGVDFKLNESVTRQLRKLGAGDALVAAVKKASDEHMKSVREAPALGSMAAKAANNALAASKDIIAPPMLDAKGQTSLLERARQRALDYTKNLPSFLCLQVTTRKDALAGREEYRTLDTIMARLAYDDGHHEKYDVISVNNQVTTNKTMEDLGGAISRGEFGSLLLSVFDPQTEASFEWVRQAGLRARAVEVYDFQVRKERSQWQVTYDKKQTIFPAYRGKVWIDHETAEVLRLNMFAVDIDKDFPIQSVSSTLEYDWATISGNPFLLPASSVMQMSDGHYETKNEIQFRRYQKFSADTSIKFDGPEEPEPAKPPVKKP